MWSNVPISIFKNLATVSLFQAFLTFYLKLIYPSILDNGVGSSVYLSDGVCVEALKKLERKGDGRP